jgi:hypothetical protein
MQLVFDAPVLANSFGGLRGIERADYGRGRWF